MSRGLQPRFTRIGVHLGQIGDWISVVEHSKEGKKTRLWASFNERSKCAFLTFRYVSINQELHISTCYMLKTICESLLRLSVNLLTIMYRLISLEAFNLYSLKS